MANEFYDIMSKMRAFTMMRAGVPKGWELMREYCIPHPTAQFAGALLRNKKTGLFSLYDGVIHKSVPQQWAEDHKENDIKVARLNTGLSRAAAAERIGKSVRTLDDWENGRRHPKEEVYNSVIAAFHSITNGGTPYTNDMLVGLREINQKLCKLLDKEYVDGVTPFKDFVELRLEISKKHITINGDLEKQIGEVMDLIDPEKVKELITIPCQL